VTAEPNAGDEFAEALRKALAQQAATGEAEPSKVTASTSAPSPVAPDTKPVSTEALMRPVYQRPRVKARWKPRISDSQERGGRYA